MISLNDFRCKRWIDEVLVTKSYFVRAAQLEIIRPSTARSLMECRAIVRGINTKSTQVVYNFIDNSNPENEDDVVMNVILSNGTKGLTKSTSNGVLEEC